jgi:hypothetical protein
MTWGFFVGSAESIFTDVTENCTFRKLLGFHPPEEIASVQ